MDVPSAEISAGGTSACKEVWKVLRKDVII